MKPSVLCSCVRGTDTRLCPGPWLRVPAARLEMMPTFAAARARDLVFQRFECSLTPGNGSQDSGTAEWLGFSTSTEGKLRGLGRGGATRGGGTPAGCRDGASPARPGLSSLDCVTGVLGFY